MENETVINVNTGKEMPYGEVNIQNFQRIKQVILEEPLRFFMEGYAIFDSDFFGINSEEMPKWWKNPPCQTSACICGWANILDFKDHGGINEDLHRCRPGDWTNAEKFLKLHMFKSKRVFYVSEWPIKFRDNYEQAKTAEEAAQAAADYIDYICGI